MSTLMPASEEGVSVAESQIGFDLECPDLESMRTLADKLAEQITGRELVVFLRGDLGAGKTTLVRFSLQALGCVGRVKSPTYGLLEIYQLGTGRYVHLDLYRLTDVEELEYLGLRELQRPGTSFLVEWPELVAEMMPAPDLVLDISFSGSGRKIHFESSTSQGKHIIRQLASGLLDD